MSWESLSLTTLLVLLPFTQVSPALFKGWGSKSFTQRDLSKRAQSSFAQLKASGEWWKRALVRSFPFSFAGKFWQSKVLFFPHWILCYVNMNQVT